MGRFNGFFSTVVGIAAVAFALVWLRREPPAAAPGHGRPPYVLPVTTVSVAQGDLVPLVQLTGTVRSPSAASLAFARGGRLVELLARDGDRVESGALLARLADEDERLGLAVAEANLALAKSELALSEAGARTEVLARLAAERDERLAQQSLATLDVQRGEQLVQDNYLARAEQDRREAELAKAVARAAAAGSSLTLAEAGSRVEDIQIARAKVAVAQASVDRSAGELRRRSLFAPMDLVVVERSKALGEFVVAGEQLMRTVDVSDLEVELEIPANFVSRLGDAPQVVLRSDEISELQWSGPMDTLVPVADPRTRNFRALVRLPRDTSAASMLRPGQFVRAGVELAPSVGVLIVPEAAVRQGPAGSEVVRVSESAPAEGAGEGSGPSHNAEVLNVRVLAERDGMLAIEQVDAGTGAPLASGDRLVLRGLGLAFPRAPLLIRDELVNK
ncbi:MAG: multidrug efflux pump subunit AcrA (membrane-fusion protein) [Planctomycetota bacterium]|jgi:multidrug efflux pump subunit AcrA (membrane-fusion protein)